MRAKNEVSDVILFLGPSGKIGGHCIVGPSSAWTCAENTMTFLYEIWTSGRWENYVILAFVRFMAWSVYYFTCYRLIDW